MTRFPSHLLGRRHGLFSRRLSVFPRGHFSRETLSHNPPGCSHALWLTPSLSCFVCDSSLHPSLLHLYPPTPGSNDCVNQNPTTNPAGLANTDKSLQQLRDKKRILKKGKNSNVVYLWTRCERESGTSCTQLLSMSAGETTCQKVSRL